MSILWYDTHKSTEKMFLAQSAPREQTQIPQLIFIKQYLKIKWAQRNFAIVVHRNYWKWNSIGLVIASYLTKTGIIKSSLVINEKEALGHVLIAWKTFGNNMHKWLKNDLPSLCHFRQS